MGLFRLFLRFSLAIRLDLVKCIMILFILMLVSGKHMSIIWIASYPKSGNTFVGFLLQNCFYQKPESADEVEHNVPWVRNLSLERVNQDGVLFSKTHYVFSPDHPYYQYTLGAIVIVRNPRDVLLNNIHCFRIMNIQQDKTETNLAFDFILHHGMTWWVSHGYGTWTQNIRSWCSAPIPKCIITYESLVKDTEKVFRTILNYLEVTIDEQKLKTSLANSTFESMSKIEEEDQKKQHSDQMAFPVFSVTKAAYQSGLRFVNKGRSDQSLDSIFPGLDCAFDQSLAEVMVENGYTQSCLSQRSIITPEGIQLSYLTKMRDYPYTVVILHGALDRGSTLAPLGNLFAGKASLLVPDQRGHGGSSQPEYGYSLDNFVHDILHLLDTEVKQSKVVLIGESFGALVAARIAQLASDRVKALLLSEPPLTPTKLPWIRQAMATAAKHHHWIFDFAYQVFGYDFMGGKDQFLGYHELVTSLGLPTLLARGGIQEKNETTQASIIPSCITQADLDQLTIHENFLLTTIPQAGHHVLRSHFRMVMNLFMQRVLPLALLL